MWISFDGALDRVPARVVRFDEQLDVAVLAVTGVQLEPLALADWAPRRGAQAAALGFTGGGRQRVIPAVVSRTIPAVGRDIYGSSIVARDVVELRADVAPGDSGGPVLLEDGTVGGVTFSESRADQSIGYALSPVAVWQSIRGALDETNPVGTGACVTV
jgi:S1-C subfamily serine protease